ncbi:MAG: hypothetical protein ACXAC7_16870, partial [Candidatus Hodarchaeales archaeon]
MLITKNFIFPMAIILPLILIPFCSTQSLTLTTPNSPINTTESVIYAITQQDDSQNITIFYINDFHGWLNPHDGYGGAATLYGYFEQEGYENTTEDSFLFLSGGDHNTGPATATLSQGRAVIDVFNAMGMDAAAIGNHEFDYGIDNMNEHQDRA